MKINGCRILDGSLSDREPPYDIGIWAAGYEERARWFIESSHARVVRHWWRVEFIEDRDKYSAPTNINLGHGELLGREAGHRNWDGHWASVWRNAVLDFAHKLNRPVRILIDYSSMPRTVYGAFVLQCLAEPLPITELSMLYVPGQHAADVDGSRTLEGLRTLAGTEGRRHEARSPAYVIGLGYDGILAEAIVEFFQIGHYCCLLAAPGVTADAEPRAQNANRRLLRRADLSMCAPAIDCGETIRVLRRIQDWYTGRNLVIVPLGPKPQVLAAIALAAGDDSIAVRFAQTGNSRPVQVTVPDGAIPHVTTLQFDREPDDD
ncbi:MAG: hypothetical protein K8W52_43465 [Deltaproteobacteria bacterium]|nr:hypothetical protein [Deltaproteobacteria bacterium]